MFKLAVLKVVIHKKHNMFLPNPAIETMAGDGSVQTEQGILHHRVWVSRFLSHDIWGKEVDTAVIFYRKGEIFSRGNLEYVGGQSDGYLVFAGFDRITIYSSEPDMIDARNPHFLSAAAFEEGDEVVFVCRDK